MNAEGWYSNSNKPIHDYSLQREEVEVGASWYWSKWSLMIGEESDTRLLAKGGKFSTLL